MNNIPRFPFATRLSGSAKETELRIRSIFQWKKQRPPLWAMILAALAILSCGGLVSCQRGEAAPPLVPQVTMSTQFYDYKGDYIKLPSLEAAQGQELSAGAQTINEGLAQLAQSHQWALDRAADPEDLQAVQCLFYPAHTSRYLNLIFFLSDDSYGNDGQVRSWVYDKQTGEQVTVQQALELAGVTQEELLGGLEELVSNSPDFSEPVIAPVPIQTPAAIQGFRLREDGGAVFYLSVTTDFAPTAGGGEYDPWAWLYLWEDGTYTHYGWSLRSERPLVPAGACSAMDPPLYWQWYYVGGSPEGGFISPEPEPETPPSYFLEDTAPIDALRAVLDEEAAFRMATSWDWYTLDRLDAALFGGISDDICPESFSVIDLDQDGAPEVVVLSNNHIHSEPILILRYQDGVVYGYEEYGRTFDGLKEDGTFSYSSSASTGGTGRVKFEKDAWMEEAALWITQPIFTQEEGSFYHNGQRITGWEYDRLTAQQDAKPDALWYDFTPDNIAAVFSQPTGGQS